jgi:pimeloyl-ACP methyl ester carboxylesterase
MSDGKMAISASDWIAKGSFFPTSNGFRIFYRKTGHGQPLVMLHGFPTWSYDYAKVSLDLSSEFHVITFDFLGYGASDKPQYHQFTVNESADIVEELLKHLGISDISLVIHDYGGIVGQELLDRTQKGKLSFDIKTVHLLNSGIVYSAYRPTIVQRMLATPIIGSLIVYLINQTSVRRLIDRVRGESKLTDDEFQQLWTGISLDNGHRLAHYHIRYNTERAEHHKRWEEALYKYKGRLQLIWGMADPISGKHVLDLARPLLPNAHIVELPNVGHFPQSEDPKAVSAAIRSFEQGAISIAGQEGISPYHRPDEGYGR